MGNLALAVANAIYDFKHENYLTLDELYRRLDHDINLVEVKVYREDKSVPLPAYGKDGDACMDIVAKSIEYDLIKDRWIVHTGLHFELPQHYEMEIRPRSSNTKYDVYIPNAPGTLDAGYRGELLAIFKRRDATVVQEGDIIDDIFPYNPGDRICQILVRRREEIHWHEVDNFEDLSTSERGTGGFGSTGK